MLKPNLSKSSTKSFGFKKVILILIGVLIVGFALWRFAYHPYAVRQDKKRFEQAQHSIDTLYEAIKTQVGEPAVVDKKQFCTYASREVGSRPLSCNVSVDFEFSGQGSEQATQITEKINTILGDSKDISGISYSNTNTSLPFQAVNSSSVYMPQKSVEEFYEKYSKLLCALSSTYILRNKPTLLLEITCGGLAKSAYYLIQ